MTNTTTLDLLEGAAAIAEFTGLSRRAVFHAIQHDRLPVFRLGRSIYARKSELVAALSASNNAAA